MITLSKTNYLSYRDCKKNTWYKIHQPNIYSQFPLSEFDKLIMETGNEVESIARQLFPEGKLITEYGEEGQKVTHEYMSKKEPILFQPVFIIDGFQAAVDVLKFNPKTNSYSIYEIKSTNDVEQKLHPYDLAFQVNLLRRCGLNVDSINLIHLNSEYIRHGNLDIETLFKVVDLTEEINGLCEEVSIDMEGALEYLSKDSLSNGHCLCVYRGRSNHCTTFSISNPDIPAYGIHDISRIGSSKAKLAELVDSNVFNIHEIPLHIKLSPSQQNQVDTHKNDRIIIERNKIIEELTGLVFPLYFLDYETFPAAIPRFKGFSPYTQIPFQYSLYILRSADAEIEHLEFIHVESEDPTRYIAESLQKDIGDTGSVIVWYKNFESTINNQMGERIPELKPFTDSVNARIYDLMDIFHKQYYVHKGFKGSSSIKNVLPVLVPELTYKELAIQDGGTAAQSWNRIITEGLEISEKEKIIEDLKIYCGLDTYAMYSIWQKLQKIS